MFDPYISSDDILSRIFFSLVAFICADMHNRDGVAEWLPLSRVEQLYANIAFKRTPPIFSIEGVYI
jgi:hypothetical protein